MTRLLLIDDDIELAELLSEYLSLEGFEVDLAHNGEEGLAQALTEQHDLLLLDVMMPKLNGFEVLQQLRKQTDLPVLMLTAKGDEIDRVLGLEMGADDYLPKPFSDRELLARIRAILRRTHAASSKQDKEEISHLDIRLQPGKQKAYCREQEIELTSTEYLLLQTMVSHPGEVLSKAELSENVLGKKLAPYDRSIDMHLSNLRKKLPARADGQARVKTLRGRGYMWLEGDD